MTAETTTKRKRVVASQSRNGCYTCKARRIKCDERRPTCLRCERSKQSCSGYRDQEPLYDIQESKNDTVAIWQSSLPLRWRRSNPAYALSYRLDDDPFRSRFAFLGSTALQCGSSNLCGRGRSVWTTTLPQYTCSVPAVALSLAALGSAIESTSIERATSGSVASDATAKLYGAAVAEMQMALSSLEQPHECLVVACLLLGCADIVQWHEVSAMAHVEGAFALLRARRRPKPYFSICSNDVDTQEPSFSLDEEIFTPIDELDLLLVQLDLQTASYALGIPPRLPRVDLRYFLDTLANERQQSDLELEVTQAVHSCYRVAHALSHYKYTGRDSVPNELAFQQARCIAELLACLNKLGRHLKPLEPGLELTDAFQRTAFVLRSQCLVGLIYVSMVTNGPECGWDAYASCFQQVVADAELLFSSDPDQRSMLNEFSIGLGILQPLFLTATKYRDPIYRRRAIALLGKGGREGPWHGPQLAAVASRAVEIEESGVVAQGFQLVTASDVPETARLNGIGLDIERAMKPNILRLHLNLSRCYDVIALTSSAKKWADREADKEHWDMWTETLYW